MLACSQRGALEERRTKSTHEMFPAPHSQSSAWHANINFIFTDTFFNSREGLRQKARTARSLPKSRNLT